MAWLGSFKRRLTWLVALGLWYMVAPSVAEDPILARILSIESDRVILSAIERPTRDSEPIILPMRASDLPPGLVPGSLVRLWPGTALDSAEVSAGMRPMPLDHGMAERDRTGVRARLMRGAERGFTGGRGGR